MKKLIILLFFLIPAIGICQTESPPAEWEKIVITSDPSYTNDFNNRFADVTVTLGIPRVIKNVEDLSPREIETFKKTAFEMKCKMIVIPADQFGREVTQLLGGAIK